MVRSKGSNNYCAKHNHGSISLLTCVYVFVRDPTIISLWDIMIARSAIIIVRSTIMIRSFGSNNYLPEGDHGSISLLTCPNKNEGTGKFSSGKPTFLSEIQQLFDPLDPTMVFLRKTIISQREIMISLREIIIVRSTIMNTVPKQNIWTEKIHQRDERIKGLE